MPSTKPTQLDTSGLLPPLTLPNLLKMRFTANISHPLQNFNAACMPTFVLQVLNVTHNDCMIYNCGTRIKQQRPGIAKNDKNNGTRRGVSRWFTLLACGSGSPELSKSYMDMASKFFPFTCVVLSFGVMPGWCCFLRVTHYSISYSPHGAATTSQLRPPLRNQHAHRCLHGKVASSRPLHTARHPDFKPTASPAKCPSIKHSHHLIDCTSCTSRIHCCSGQATTRATTTP